jgi:hypothetical protein
MSIHNTKPGTLLTALTTTFAAPAMIIGTADPAPQNDTAAASAGSDDIAGQTPAPVTNGDFTEGELKICLQACKAVCVQMEKRCRAHAGTCPEICVYRRGSCDEACHDTICDPVLEC